MDSLHISLWYYLAYKLNSSYPFEARLSIVNLTQKILIVDALSYSFGRKLSTVDVIGAGPRTVAGVLEPLGYSVNIIPLDLFLEKAERLNKYDILMLSGMTTDEPSIVEAIAKWKKVKKYKSLTIVGGPISLNPSALIRTGADILIKGEAEATVEELFKKGGIDIDKNELSKIKGLCYLDGKTVSCNRERELLSGEALSRYRPSTKTIEGYPGFWFKRVYVEVVRGCSNLFVAKEMLDYLRSTSHSPKVAYAGCAYCSVVGLWGAARSFNENRIIEEVKGLIDKGVRRIVLSSPDILDYGRDELFKERKAINPREPGPNLNRLNSLFRGLFSIPEVASGEVTVLIENIKPSLVTEDAAKLLGYYFHGTTVNMGIESGDDLLLKRVGRPHSLAEGLRAVNLLTKYGLRVHVYMIYGLPMQDENSIKKSIALIDEFLPNERIEKITLYKFIPIPRSLLENYPVLAGKSRNLIEFLRKVREFNIMSKKRLLGTNLRVIVASYYKGKYWCYPIKHGPVIVCKKSTRKNPLGRIAKVKVTSIISDRIAEGEFISLGRYVAKRSFWEGSAPRRF